MGNTGASGAIPRNDFNRMEEHAERFYEEIRNRTSDIGAIAKNTGFAKEDILNIKQHIFFNEYDLGKKNPVRFDPNYDMAVSWQRLIDGNVKEMDMILLNHELIELKLMKQGLNYDEAHKMAEAIYNYTKYTKELDEKEGIF